MYYFAYCFIDFSHSLFLGDANKFGVYFIVWFNSRYGENSNDLL
jgi:hypothetical protein